jgi:conjugative transposon TraM protein
MKINFNQPKYILPLIILPFLFFFFWVYNSMSGNSEQEVKDQAGMQNQVGNASAEVQKSAFDDKLDAFTEQFKQADGNSAVNAIDGDANNLDSIDQLMKQRFNTGPPGSSAGLPYAAGMTVQQQGLNRLSNQDQALADALAQLRNGSGVSQANAFSPYTPGYPAQTYPQELPVVKEKDPMELFKAQMKYMDSIGKAADPEYQAELKRQKAVEKAEQLRTNTPLLSVSKASDNSSVFNTVKPGKPDNFITAVIDENVTGYAGSRIRLRLLEDIRAGKTLVKKGTYLYALINGFGDQRVALSVRSILQDGKILPVKLDLYDTDGLPGLYVPESAFREFTKDLSGNSMQGVNLQGNSTDANQFLMSSIDKMFQSTSAAIASLIRKNKAKIKYNSYIYLIDPEALQNAQRGY